MQSGLWILQKHRFQAFVSLMRNIRPDLKEYIGGAGFLYDTPEEASKLLQHKWPEEMRDAGFKQAEKSSPDNHLRLLKIVWLTSHKQSTL